ncbi:hypothetical protein VaNZ11_016103 [Volvox africanus]|uniref:FAD-binding FR-type domain-containing protein n=1 Tax=Volvox africanus TaxID=51714 RepID=A0ABQ5SMI2_9CHLO|nr:hypothetical protein VaNZ11_016103 [Volvox africanus]
MATPSRSSAAAMHRFALRAAHATLLIIIGAGAITFAFFYTITPTRWYNVRATELVTWRNTLILQYKFANATTGKTTPLLSGGLSFILIWQWCGTLAVALGTAGMLWLSSSSATGTANATANPPRTASPPKMYPERQNNSSCARSCWSFPAARAAAIKQAIMRVRRLLRYQVPPRSLWRRLLGPGGLTLLDWLLVLLWFGLHLMWMREMTMRVLDSRSTTRPPAKGTAVVVRSPPLIKAPSSSAVTNRSSNSFIAPPPKFMLPSPSVASINASSNGTANGGAVRRSLQTTPSAPAAAGAPAGGAGNTVTGSPGGNFSSSPSAAKTPSSRPPPAKAVAPPPPAKKLKPLPAVVQDRVSNSLRPLSMCQPLRTYWHLVSPSTQVGLADWTSCCSSFPFPDATSSTGFWDPISPPSSSTTGGLESAPCWYTPCMELPTWASGRATACVFLYLLDVVLRTIQQNFNCVRLVGRTAADEHCNNQFCRNEGAAIARVSSEAVLLSLSIPCHQSLRWVGADMVFLNVPAISWWQWHPFTITSAPGEGPGSENQMEIRIKSYNRWTKALISQVSSNPRFSLTLYVSGPYDSGNRKWITDFDTHVFVADDIGITPVLGMLAELLAFRRRQFAAAAAAATANDANADNRSVGMRRAILIWVSRTMDELRALPEDILQEASMKEPWLDLRLYLSAPSVASAVKVPDIITTDKAYGENKGVQLQPSGVSRSNSGSSSPSPKADPIASPASVVSSPSDGVVFAGSSPPVAATATASAVTTAASLGLEALHGVASRPLSHPYMFNPLIWMVAVLLGFGGGFAGLICAQAYDAHKSRTVALRQDFSYMGMLQFSALGLGATLPPAVLMLGLHLYRRLARSSSWPRSGSGSKTSISLFERGSFNCKEVPAMVPFGNGPSTTGTQLLPAPTLTSYIAEGRPNLAALLHQIAITGSTCSTCNISASLSRSESNSSSQSGEDGCKEAGVEAARVAVYAGGPKPLVGSVEETCASHNGLWGRKDRAYLHFTFITHEL